MRFTLLKKEQISGNEALDVMGKYGIYTAPTDFAVILGGGIEEDGSARTPEGDFPCTSWTQSLSDDGRVFCSSSNNEEDLPAAAPLDRAISVRPVLPPEETANIQLNEIESKIPGVDICTYGEYPQTLADKQTSKKLENLFEDGSLDETGKEYTFDSNSDFWMGFKKITLPEYELDGKRYVRIEGKSIDFEGHAPILSSGEKVEIGEPYWVQVEPIEWLRDETGTLISKKCLFSGIRFNNEGAFEDFSDTEIHSYLNTYFADEIESHTKELVKERNPRQEAYGVKVSEERMSLKELIDFNLTPHQTIMLHGPSGIGKTRRLKEIDPNLTSITLCNGILPEEVIGKNTYPSISADLKDALTGVSGALADSKGIKDELEKTIKDTVVGKMVGGVWQPPHWYTELCEKCAAEPDKKHILFIDEVTNARESTQSLIFHLVETRCIAANLGKLPDNAVVALAGNSKEESSAAYNMPRPLFGRLTNIYLEPSIEDWLEWGSERCQNHPEDPNRLKIHPLIAGFVATYGKSVFYSEYDDENPPKFVLDPRRWEMVSNKIYRNNGVLRREILETDIGPDIAASLLEYAKNPPLSLNEVLEGRYTKDDIPTKPDACLALICNFRHVSPKQVDKVRNFIKTNMRAENLAVFDSLWVGKDDARAVKIAELRQKGGR